MFNNEINALVANVRLESSPGYPIFPLLVGFAFIGFAMYGLISGHAKVRGFTVRLVMNPVGFFFLVIFQFLIGAYIVTAIMMKLL